MTYPPFDDYDFRTHYQDRYGDTDYEYGYYGPAYRYGYDLAQDDRYNGKGWATIEDDVRADWEARDDDTAWEDVKEAVRHAWETVTEPFDKD